MTKLADAAFEQAARKVIERAEQTGTPVIVWEDDAIKELEPRTNPELPRRSDTIERLRSPVRPGSVNEKAPARSAGASRFRSVG